MTASPTSMFTICASCVQIGSLASTSVSSRSLCSSRTHFQPFLGIRRYHVVKNCLPLHNRQSAAVLRLVETACSGRRAECQRKGCAAQSGTSAKQNVDGEGYPVIRESQAPIVDARHHGFSDTSEPGNCDCVWLDCGGLLEWGKLCENEAHTPAHSTTSYAYRAMPRQRG